MRKSMKDRFDEKWEEDTSTGCWEWTAYKSALGYGNFKVQGKHQLSHRVAFELYKGSIPNGNIVRHTCNNRSCVNPEHLVLGTQFDNMDDLAKSRGTEYLLESPEGVVHKFYNMSKFCRDNNLSQGCVSTVINGKAKQHKGWTKPSQQEINE